MKYGYARVSPGGKSESVEAQARQLTNAGCKKVFRDLHVSGAKTDRAQLRRAIAELEPGDVLMVTRLDRLARSTRDLLNTLAAIADRKAGFRSLSDAWADTITVKPPATSPCSRCRRPIRRSPSRARRALLVYAAENGCGGGIGLFMQRACATREPVIGRGPTYCFLDRNAAPDCAFAAGLLVRSQPFGNVVD